MEFDPIAVLYSQVDQTQVYWDFWIFAASAVIGVLFTVKLSLLSRWTVAVIFVLWMVFAASNYNGLQSNIERREALANFAKSKVSLESCPDKNYKKCPEFSVIEVARPGNRIIVFQLGFSLALAAAIIIVPSVRKRLETPNDN